MDDEKQPSGTPRIRSIDILCGMTIMVMLFVNDIASVDETRLPFDR